MRSWRHGAVFVLAAGTVAHLGFSWIGFTPMDEGFVLAASRRLLDGQVPHRDFISIYPAGAYVTFMPVVRLGGDFTIWLSRWAGWLQMAAVAWCWTAVLDRACRLALSPAAAVSLSLLSFFLAVHDFPVMAWTTINALWFAAAGAALVWSRRPGAVTAGYAVLGAACLSRQSFLPVAPAALLLTGDWRRPGRVLAAALPPVAAVAALGGLGALADAAAQLQGSRDPSLAAVKRYLLDPHLPWTIGLGYASAALLLGDARLGASPDVRRTGRLLGLFALTGLALWSAIEMRRGSFADEESFAVFGAAAGALACLAAGAAPRPRVLLGGALTYAWCVALLSGLTRPAAAVGLLGALVAAFGWAAPRVRVRPGDGPPLPVALRREAAAAAGLLVLTAWCSSISFGYNTPALMAGPLAALLLGIVLLAARHAPAVRPYAGLMDVLLPVAAAVAGLAFGLTRARNVYVDAPAWELTRPVGGLVNGGRFIRTNPYTAAYLADLGEAVRAAGGRPYCIVTENASHWIRSPRPNPLPLDWANGFSPDAPALFARVIAALTATPDLVIIVGRTDARSLTTGFSALREDWPNRIPFWVRAHGRRIGGTRLFELYRPPAPAPNTPK